MILRLFISCSLLLLFIIYLIPAWEELEPHTITFCFTFQTGLRHKHRMDYSPCVNLAAMKNAGQVPCLQSHFPSSLSTSHGWEAPLQLRRGCSCPGSVPGPLSKLATRNGRSGGSNAAARLTQSSGWLPRALGQRDTQKAAGELQTAFLCSDKETQIVPHLSFMGARISRVKGWQVAECKVRVGRDGGKKPSAKKRLFFKECICALVNKSVLSAPY